MSMQRIAEYLAGMPQGASRDQIAGHLGASAKCVGDSLLRMLRRGKVERDGKQRNRGNVVWSLARPKAAPGSFNAMATLAAMQAACREQLANKTYGVTV